MPANAKSRSTAVRSADSPTPRSTAAQVKDVLASLRRAASTRIRDEMGPRYGIHAPRALGVKMSDMHKVAKAAGRSHALAMALWATGWYEARTVAVFVAEPDRLTGPEMDRWARDFDNWAICDTACFHLFDRVEPALAFGRVDRWARSRDEFVKRAAFALVGCLAMHNKDAPDGAFLSRLALIEKAATDERNFVKKGVSWGLRCIGRARPTLRTPVLDLSRRLAASDDPAARWIGKDALKDLRK